MISNRTIAGSGQNTNFISHPRQDFRSPPPPGARSMMMVVVVVAVTVGRTLLLFVT